MHEGWKILSVIDSIRKEPNEFSTLPVRHVGEGRSEISID